MFVDADDELVPGFVDRAVAALAADPKLGYVVPTESALTAEIERLSALVAAQEAELARLGPEQGRWGRYHELRDRPSVRAALWLASLGGLRRRR